MSQKHAGGIFVSSFVAGLLLAAALYAPRAWEPVPGPYFGLDEPNQHTTDPDTAAGMERVHAELSARAQPSMATASVPPATPVMPVTTSPAPLPPLRWRRRCRFPR